MSSISLSPTAQAGPAGHSCMSSCKNKHKMKNNMKTAIVFWGYIGIMEKKMETTIVYWG